MGDAQPITGLRPGQVAERVFLCGDPARVDRIAERFDRAERVCEYAGEDRSDTDVVEELVKLGTTTLLRVGNSGGLSPRLDLGDLVITTGAVRDDGTSRTYVIPEYPAVADPRLVTALLDAAGRLGVPHHAGITWSLDAFYARNAVLRQDGSLAPMTARGYWPSHLAPRIADMRAAGVLNCEMESGVLLTLAGLYGVRAACVCVVSDRTPWPGPAELDLDRNMAACIDVAVEAMLAAP